MILGKHRDTGWEVIDAQELGVNTIRPDGTWTELLLVSPSTMEAKHYALETHYRWSLQNVWLPGAAREGVIASVTGEAS